MVAWGNSGTVNSAQTATEERGLPALPSIALNLHRRQGICEPLADRLAAIVTQAIRSELAG